MNFPITRERLRNYTKNEAILVERKQRLEKVIQTICKEIEQIILRTNDTKYIYRINNDTKGDMKPLNKLPQQTSILDEVIDKLNELFIDCTIQVDPLKTYILIDWS